jgi:hypothetical protein
MACVSGSNIVSDGLVFQFDMDNVQKSWKGKPTTNLFSNPTNLASGWITNNTSYNSSTQKAYITSNSAGNYFLQDRSLTSGLEYTISLEAKASESYIIQLTPSTGFTIADYANINLIDGSISGTATGISKANSFYLGKGWWRVSYTETATSTGSGRIAFAIGDNENYTRLSSASGLSVNDGLFIRAAQFEQNSFATPFVNGTRSNTQSIIDLSPTKSTITAANLSYQENDTPTLDGTDDYIEISDNTPYRFTNTQPFTINAWVNWNNTTGGHTVLSYSIASGRGYYFNLFTGTNIAGVTSNSYTFDYWDGTSFRGILGVNNSITSGSWIMLTATSATNSVNDMEIYQNGVLTSHTNRGSSSPSSINYDTLSLRIGARGSGNYFNGEISQVKIYNKALTAAEVKQNFEATRSRYGI